MHTQLADLRLLAAHYVQASSVRSTIRDFDLLGGSQAPVTATVNGGTYTPQVLPGPATGNYLQLTDGGGGESTTVAFDQACTLSNPIFGRAPVIPLDFDVRAQGSADGFGLVLLRTDDYGSTGGGVVASEEPNVSSAGGPNFGVGFDIYQNGGEPNNNHVSLYYGSKITDNTPTFDMSTTQFHHAHVRIAFRTDMSGADVTVILQQNSLGMDTTVSGSPETVINSAFVPGFTPYDYRIQFGARTGGATALQQIDNLYVVNGKTAFAYGGDMRGAGPDFTLQNNASFRTDTGGGVYQEWLNLTPAANGQTAGAWLNSKVDVKNGFSTDFDWRINLMNGTGADGLSFVIQNIGTGIWTGERGPLTDALTIGFDSYQGQELWVNDGDTTLQFVNLWDHGFYFDYNPQSDPYMGRYNVHVDYFPGDLDVYLNDVLVVDSLDVRLDNLANGNAVDGNGEGYVGFGARTGGSNQNHDILNWRLATLEYADAGTLFLIK